MIKRVFSTIAVASFAIASFAGGLLTNTNQSAAFVRNPARYASLEADAVYFNPAGTAFLNEGWNVSANWQMIWQSRDVMNGGKEYKGKVYVPCMPTFFATYKTGDWAFSGFFGMPGGGGNAQFEDGLPMFNQMGDLFGSLAPLFTGAQAGGPAYSNFESTQYLFALQLGAAYKINENLSAYAGLRTNYTSLSYEGAINLPLNNDATAEVLALDLTQTGIAFAPIVGLDYKAGKLNIGVKYEFRAVNIIENATNNLGVYGINSKNGFDKMLATVNGGAPSLAPMMVVRTLMESGMTQEAAAAMVQNGMAAGDPTIMSYVRAANQQIIAGGEGAAAKLASLRDGEKFRNDAPSKLSVGVSYDICDRVKVMGAGVYYFDKDATIESLLGKANTMKKLDRNTYELLAGIEVKVTDKLMLSSGIQFSDFGVNNKFLSDVSFIDDSFMVGFGGKYSLNENWDLNFGGCYANYAHGHSETGSQYLRKTFNAAVGVDFRF